MEIKRLTAKKACIVEIVRGKFVERPGFESNYVITGLGRRLSRVRILGNVVDKYISSESQYAAITLDDSTETIRCKFFRNLRLIENIELGDLVDVVGKIRNGGEIYINVELIKKIDNPNFEILRWLELIKIWKEQKEKMEKVRELKKQTSDVNELYLLTKDFLTKKELEGILEAEKMFEIEENSPKDIILKLIEKYDDGNGADYEILLKEANLPEEIFDQAIQQLLESGLCFEPKPGKIKRV
jgi:RPA family protein